MSRAGRNTPESVSGYIDAIWEMHEPPDPIALARELGYSPKGIRRLQEKHGDKLVIYLQRRRRELTEEPRFMARQHGALKPEQYVDNPHGAIDDLEAVDDATLVDLTHEARRRQEQAAEPLVLAIAEMRAAIRARIEMHPAFHRQFSRDVFLLFGRLDALERNIKRRNAA